MKSEIKRKWVEALRSGKYRQGQSMLYDAFNDCYCCLGVLCDIMGMEKGGRNNSNFKYKELEFSDYLPVNIASEVGFDYDSYKLSQEYYASLNDDIGFSFEDIATAIERNFPDENE